MSGSALTRRQSGHAQEQGQQSGSQLGLGQHTCSFCCLLLLKLCLSARQSFPVFSKVSYEGDIVRICMSKTTFSMLL